MTKARSSDTAKKFVRDLSQRIDTQLDAVAAIPPPPVALSLQKVLAVSVPMQSAALISLLLHVVMVFGVGFQWIDPRKFAPPHNIMDVVLVNSKSFNAPTKADALAQANLDGGGNTDEERRAKTPLPAMEQQAAQNDLRAALERVKQLESEMKTLQTQARAVAKIVQGQAAPPAGQPLPEAAKELMEKSIEIAKLEAQLAKEYEAYQQRPKRKFIGARTTENRFAIYVDNWREKIERVGNLNYPEEAKTRGIRGKLQLTVAIKSNGEVESIEINNPSGKKVLDEAAKRIVRLAAPFEPFPPHIKRDTDVMHITRTWMFTKADTVEAR
jgi:periplasmic protein TonB